MTADGHDYEPIDLGDEHPNAPREKGKAATRRPVKATPYVWTDPTVIPLREWLYGRHLIRKFVSATVAPGGMGKTSLGIAETIAMVSGKNLLGGTLPHVGRLRAWYLNLEDPREEITRQVQAAALYYNLTADDFGDRLFIDSGREQQFVIAETVAGHASICWPIRDSIVAALKSLQIDCICVDPFVSSHEVAENGNGEMDLVVKEWGRVADEANCAVHLFHHTRKIQGDTEVTVEASRGAKSMTDGGRSIRVLNRMTKEEGERAGVVNPRLFFRAYIDKGNLTPPMEASDWYRLQSVSLGNGKGRPSDELGVVTKWELPDAFSDITAQDLRNVQLAIAGGEWKESAQAKTWVGLAVAEVLGLDATDAAHKAKIKALLKQWIRSGALTVDRRPGPDRHVSPFVIVGQWASLG